MDSNILAGLHSAEFKILCDFDRVCRKNNLTYFLCSGTLLGSVRHKGFIPWDDDIDVCMPIKDYKKFCKIANKELDSKFFFQNYQTDFCYWFFGKIRMNNTTCIEKGWENKKIHQGVWIDLFPIIGVYADDKKNQKLNRIQNRLKKLLKLKFDSLSGKKVGGGKRTLIRFVPVSLIRKCVSLCTFFIHRPHTKFEQCCYLWGTCEISNRFKSTLFQDLTELQFEGESFYVPKAWDEILTKEYGDYMTPPPPDKRNGGDHEISIVDLSKDYKEYIKNFK